jgi:hypothetical protein
MIILIPVLAATYVIQLVVFFVTIATDAQYENILPRVIATKKQALLYITPFGFLYALYLHWKTLN